MYSRQGRAIVEPLGREIQARRRALLQHRETVSAERRGSRNFNGVCTAVTSHVKGCWHVAPRPCWTLRWSCTAVVTLSTCILGEILLI